MHVVFRESHGLDQSDTPQDLGQTPAELIVLSFSDSDLGAFAAGYHRAKGSLPSLRLANLVALKHPLSVDVYAEQTLEGAKGILVRLIGGESYWSYGLATLQDLARRKGIALAILPADGREDPRLDELSTLPVSTLRRLQHLCDAGGAVAAQAALAQLALAAGLYAAPVIGAKTVPDAGFYLPTKGVIAIPERDHRPLALVTFYRSYLTSADTSPVDAMIEALEERGFQALGVFASSLKAPNASAWLREQIAFLAPAAIVNATAFSAQGREGEPSPLDAAGCPVFQIALSTARKKDWLDAERGLSPADLAMHVVLPEVDGRIFAGVASFKQPSKRDPELEYSRFAHRANPERIAALADRVLAWHVLATLPTADKRIALVLSTYPGKQYQIAHAVGMDALASAEQILTGLASSGHTVQPQTDLGQRLTTEALEYPLAEYLEALDTLPQSLRDDLYAAWGPPETDPLFPADTFLFPAIDAGNALVALQPERGDVAVRDDDYHDLSRTPRHSYVAFYLWLRAQSDALVHIGAHGTLEWLPGKSVALSDACWPEALIRDLPVIYPFIVNDPGEAAQAKRRIAAVTIGHLPPPMAQTKLPEGTRFEMQMQYGSIGWSVGASLGYALGNRKRRLISCIGDGSFQLTAQEISTMIRYDAQPIIFLINNGGYTIEVEIHDGPYNTIKNWDYAGLIDVFSAGEGNAWGCKVTPEGELAKAINTAIDPNGLWLVGVQIDRDDCNVNLLRWGNQVARNNGRPNRCR